MKKIAAILSVLVTASCSDNISTDLNIPLLGKPYPYNEIFKREEKSIITDFLSPSPGGKFLEIFQNVKVTVMTETKEVLIIEAERAYLTPDECHESFKKIWDLAEIEFGAPKKNGSQDWYFSSNNKSLYLECKVYKGSPHSILSVRFTDTVLLEKQQGLHIQAAKGHLKSE